jgi:hypothetical protein
MNLPEQAKYLIRSIFYAAAGVFPALCLAALSLFLMAGGGFGLLLSLSAWLGTGGLLLALICPPSRYTSRISLLICALLMVGLIAIFPLLATLALNPNSATRNLELLAIIAGPTLTATHYLWRAMQLFTACERRLAGLILILLLVVPGSFYLTRAAPPKQVIHATAKTDEISLAIQEAVPELTPSMGLSYVLKLPYKAIHYQGRTYKPLHAKAWLSTPWTGYPSRYLVTESLRANSASNNWPQQITWTVRDQQTDQLMAKRVLWRRSLTREWSRDTPNGWQGDHAKDFIGSVLKPDSRPGGDWFEYPRAEARIETLPTTKSIALATVNRRISGCKNSIELGNENRRDYVQSLNPDWRFESRYNIKQVFCLGTDVYVLSSILAEDIYVDHLNNAGHFKGHVYVNAWRNAHREGIRFKHASSLHAEQGSLSLQLEFLREWPTTEITQVAEKTVRLHVEIDH